jgi:hypothetical protein
MGGDERQPGTGSAGQLSVSVSAAGHRIDRAQPLKVETRVGTPSGLSGQTRRRSLRLHPGQGTDMGFQHAPKGRSSTLSELGRLSLSRSCPADDINTSRRAVGDRALSRRHESSIEPLSTLQDRLKNQGDECA